MREIGACEAKSKLSHLLDWVEAGEEVIIARRGRSRCPAWSPDQSADREHVRGAAARTRAPAPWNQARWPQHTGSHQCGPALSMVIDASPTMTWYFDDESTAATDELLDRVSDTGAVVPGLWHLEVANAFQMAVRRHRRSLPLATLDQELRMAAPALNIALLGAA
jgi:hypothetical protein